MRLTLTPIVKSQQKKKKEKLGPFLGLSIICLSPYCGTQDVLSLQKLQKRKKERESFPRNKAILKSSDMTQILELSGKEFQITMNNRQKH